MPGTQLQRRTPWGRIALVWLAFAVLMLLINWQNIAQSRFLDPDDTLRLVQVRDLIAGQGWFDLHQYRINPGASPIMHWSRIVDAPLALVILMLSPLLGQPMAEHVAVVIVPLLTLGAIMAVVGRMAFQLFDREIAGLACLACGLSPPLLSQVQPLRIDHHGWQVFTVIFAVGALMNRRAWVGGTVAGVAIAAGLMISLEVLPLAAAFGGILLLRWLRDPAQRWGLSGYLSGLAAGLFALFGLTRGFGSLTQYCDAISPAHLVFFAIVALATAAIAARPKLPPVALLGLLGLAGCAGLAIFLAQAPQCLSGPFGNLDPLVRQYWYVNVLEGQPFWRQPFDQALPPLVQGLIAFGVTIHLWLKAKGPERGWWFDFVLLFGAALLGGLLVWRSMDFVGALSAVPIGWLLYYLLARYRAADTPLARFAVGLAAIMALLPAAPIVLARLALPANALGHADTVRESQCDLRNSAHALDRFSQATIFAPIDIGPSLLEQTHNSVVATGHHRAQLGMRDVILAFTSPEAQAHAIINRHRAGYLVVCTDLGEPGLYAARAPGGLMAQLLHGHAPQWLEPVDLGTPEPFRVWKVKP